MRRLLLLSLIFLFRHSAFAQYCMNGGPSSTDDSNVETVYIAGASGTSINFTGCPGVIGVQNLLGYSVTLQANSPYSLYLKFGTCGGNYAGAGQAWIDFNQNSVFDQSETIATWVGTPPASLTMYNFTVPANAVQGTTRMRVIQQEAGNLPLNPCAPFTWGSVMDFSVVIQGSVNCSAYRGDTKADAIEVLAYPYSDTNSTYICYSNANPVYPSPDVYYLAVVDPGLDHMNIDLCLSGFDTYLSVFNMDDSLIAHNDDGLNCAPRSQLLIPVTGYDSLLIVVEGWGTDTGTYILNINQMNVVSTEDGLVDGVSLSPNPTSGMLRIEGMKPEEVVVSTLEGKACLRVMNSQSIDLGGLPAGVYFLGMRNEERWIFKKVVVE